MAQDRPFKLVSNMVLVVFKTSSVAVCLNTHLFILRNAC